MPYSVQPFSHVCNVVGIASRGDMNVGCASHSARGEISVQTFSSVAENAAVAFMLCVGMTTLLTTTNRSAVSTSCSQERRNEVL